MCYGMLYAGSGCGEGLGVSIIRVALRGTIAVIAVLILISLSACASPGGYTARESGTISNSFTINTGVPGQVPVVTGKLRAGESPTTNPTATAESTSSVSASGQGNVVIHFEQGTSKAQIPVSTGVAASMPAGAAGGGLMGTQSSPR